MLEARAAGKLPEVLGMIGDFVQTDLEHAPLVEAALSGADQQLVVRYFDELRQARRQLAEILGDSASVEILCLDRLGSLSSDFDLSLCPQALARVVDFVRCDDWLAPAIWRMLGTTAVVKDLADAASAAAICPDGWRFVTLSGEVLEADGRVRLGAVNRSGGIVLRRSELADLQVRDVQLQKTIDELTSDCATTQSQRQHLEELQHKLRTAIYEANTERVECDALLEQRHEQVAQLERERPLIAGEVEHLAAEIDSAMKQEHEAKDKACELETLSAQRQKGIDLLTKEIEDARQKQAAIGAQVTETKIALAASDQRKLAVRETLASLARQREQMSQDFSALRGEIELNRQRRTDAEAAIAAGREEHQRLTAEQQTLSAEAADLAESRKGLQEKIEEIRRLLVQQRNAQEEGIRAASGLRVELGEADVRIENLITRCGDEMHMNLLEAFAGYRHEDGTTGPSSRAKSASSRPASSGWATSTSMPSPSRTNWSSERRWPTNWATSRPPRASSMSSSRRSTRKAATCSPRRSRPFARISRSFSASSSAAAGPIFS